MAHDIEAVEQAVLDQAALTPTEVEVDSGKVIQRVQAITKAIDGAVKVSLQRTNVSDWVKMGDKYYLQASGCQKIRAVWGIYFRDKDIVKEDYPDGSYGYYVTGKVGAQLLDRFYGKEITIEADGGRSSKDPFFTGKDGMKQPDPMDVRKAAVSNFEARAITSFLGLKNFTAQDLINNGIPVDKVTKVEYQKGAEGGGNTAVISEAQRKRLFAICNANKVSEPMVKEYLAKHYKIDSTSKILRADYEKICAWAEKGGVSEIQVDRDPGSEG